MFTPLGGVAVVGLIFFSAVETLQAGGMPQAAAYTTALRMLRAAGCRMGSRVLVIGIGGGVATGALLLAHLRLWMPLLPALLTSGVAVAAHQSIEQYVDPTQMLTPVD